MNNRLRDEVQVLVDGLAASLEQSVAIEDPDGNIITISPHYGDEDGYRLKLVLERTTVPEYREFFDPYVSGLVNGTLDSPVQVPPNSELMIVGRIGYAIRDAGRVIALLWFIDRGKDLPEDTIRNYCNILAGLLSQRSRVSAKHSPIQTSQSLKRVLSGDEGALDETTIWLTDAQTEFFVIAALSTQPKHSADQGTLKDTSTSRVMRNLLRGPLGQRLSLACLTQLNGLEVAVYGGSFQFPEELTQTTRTLFNLAERGFTQNQDRQIAALAGPGKLPKLRHLYVQAALTAFLASHLHRSNHVSNASSMLGLLTTVVMPLDDLEPPNIEALKTMLLDPDGFAFATFDAILHSNGSQAEALEVLRIHRTTLHYRLQQIEERTGLNVNAPSDMFIATTTWLRVAAYRSEMSPLLSEWRKLTDRAC